MEFGNLCLSASLNAAKRIRRNRYRQACCMANKKYQFPFSYKPANVGNYPSYEGFLLIPYVDSTNAQKIISSAVEGAMTVYNQENWMELVISMLESDFFDCNRLADCLLNNPVFRDSLAGIVNAIIQNNEINSLGAFDYGGANEGLEAISTGLD